VCIYPQLWLACVDLGHLVMNALRADSFVLDGALVLIIRSGLPEWSLTDEPFTDLPADSRGFLFSFHFPKMNLPLCTAFARRALLSLRNTTFIDRQRPHRRGVFGRSRPRTTGNVPLPDPSSRVGTAARSAPGGAILIP
jgi:hypothetical protein